MDRHRPSLPRSDSFFNYPMDTYQNNEDITEDIPSSSNYGKGNYDESQNYINQNDFYSFNEDPYYTPEWEQQFEQTVRNRNASLRWNTALRQTVENMPSKSLPKSFTAKHLWSATAGATLNMQTPLEQHAITIAGRMEKDPLLMDDSPLSEQLRQETIRDIPQCLTIKRLVRKRLIQTVSQKSKRKPIGFFKRTKYRLKMQMTKLENSFKNFMVSFELWYSSLKKIEGNFGSSVATYFKFLRWIFLMNLLLAIPAIGFIVVPQVLYVNFMSEESSSNDSELNGNESFQWHNLFSGEGYLTNTVLYYGYYTNETVTLIENHDYLMPQAYILTMICLYIAAFVALSVSTARSYRRSFIETKSGLQNVFAQKIFCGWDYNIATRKAADLKSSALYNELKELLSDLNLENRKQTCTDKVWTRTVQLSANLGILLLLAVIGFVMWVLLEEHRNVAVSKERSSIAEFITALVINVTMVVLPILFALLTKYENYKNPRVALYVTLVRTYLLLITVVGVLLTFWLTHSEKNVCWETSIAQEIYRLVLFDFLISVVLLSILYGVRFIVGKYCLEDDGLMEFNIAQHSLQTIYNQTLLWVGFYFSPLLPVIVIIKLWFTWYIKTICTTNFCKPAERSWRAAQTKTLFLILTFLTLFLSITLFGYIMISIRTSGCGPFRNYLLMYEVITEGALDLRQDSLFWQIIMFFAAPGVIAIILIAMCAGVYFLRAKARAQKEMVKILRNMLVISAKDKEFLLNYISKVTAQQWKQHHALSDDSGSQYDKRYYDEGTSGQYDKQYNRDVNNQYDKQYNGEVGSPYDKQYYDGDVSSQYNNQYYKGDVSRQYDTENYDRDVTSQYDKQYYNGDVGSTGDIDLDSNYFNKKRY